MCHSFCVLAIDKPILPLCSGMGPRIRGNLAVSHPSAPPSTLQSLQQRGPRRRGSALGCGWTWGEPHGRAWHRPPRAGRGYARQPVMMRSILTAPHLTAKLFGQILWVEGPINIYCYWLLLRIMLSFKHGHVIMSIIPLFLGTIQERNTTEGLQRG